MSKPKRKQSKPREMKKIFLIFCEGQTEECYVQVLRSKYRVPIKIVTRVEGLNISSKEITSHCKSLCIGVDDDNVKVFLMYDMDVPLDKSKFKGCCVEYLLTNPTFELWLLLHVANQSAAISTTDVIEKLKSFEEWANYKKGTFTEQQKNILWDQKDEAINRAKLLTDEENPSSQIYKLLSLLDKESR